MSDKIELSSPDWERYEEKCPNCRQHFKTELDPDERPVLHKNFENGESDLGEFTEVQCSSCGLILQRHYPSVDISVQDDPLIEPEEWVIRAQVLKEDTALKKREAHVQSLKETGKSHEEIGNILGISESTVGEYSRRINERLSDAEDTLKEIDHSIDLSGVLEANFDGFVIGPMSSWICGNCGDSLEYGDDILVAAEFLSSGWDTFATYCTECSMDDLNHNVHGNSVDLWEYIEKNRKHGFTCAIVEGEIKPLGDAHVEDKMKLQSKNSMCLSNPKVRKLLPALEDG